MLLLKYALFWDDLFILKMKNLYASFLNKITANKKRSLLVALLILLAICIPVGIFTVKTLSTKNATPVQAKINPNKLIEISLSFDLDAKPAVLITNVRQKSTGQTPPIPFDQDSLYSVQLIGKDKEVLTSFPLTNVPQRVFRENFNSEARTISGSSETNRKGEVIITLPMFEATKIRVIDNKGNTISERDIVVDSKLSDFVTTSRIASDSNNPYRIVFVSIGYAPNEISTFTTKANQAKSFLLTKSPFKENADSIVFQAVNNTSVTPAQLGCAPYCDPNKIIELVNNSGTAYNVIVGFVKGPSFRSGANPPVSVVEENSEYLNAVIMHELGHQIGLVEDEYEYTAGENPDPQYAGTRNCFIGTPPNPAWAGIVQTKDYFASCVRSNWYRSSENSIMRDHYQTQNQFYNPISLKYLNQGMGFTTNNPPPTSGGTCVDLHAGSITKSTTFCSGTESQNRGASGIISIDADNITVDGGGIIIDGGNKTGIGILLNGHSNVTIKNFTIKNFKQAISLSNGNNLTIINNTLSGNETGANGFFNINVPIESTPGGGILATNISSSTISQNTATDQNVGINLYNSTNNIVTGNNVANNTVWGVRLSQSSNNTVSSNQAHHTGFTCGECDSAGILLVNSSHANTISNNNLTYSGDGFFIGNENGTPSNGNTVTGNDGSFSPHNCFEATFSSENVFKDNTANNCNYGFWLGFSHSTTVSGNTISNNKIDGINWESGRASTITGNTINSNGNIGLILRLSGATNLIQKYPGSEKSHDFTISSNTILNNKSDAISLMDTTDTRVEKNTLTGNNFWGVKVTGGSAVTNLSSFPAQNIFSNNKSGNCSGTGFTQSDAAGGKCPNGAGNATPNVTIQTTPKTSPNITNAAGNPNNPVPSEFQIPDPILLCVGKGGVKLNADGTPVFENGPNSKSGPRCALPPNFVNGYFDSARATPGNTAYCEKTYAAAYECKDGTSEYVPYPESNKCSEEPWCPAGTGNGGTTTNTPTPGSTAGSNPCVDAGGTCLINSSGGKACGTTGGKWTYSTEDCKSTTICYKCQGSTGGNTTPTVVAAPVAPTTAATNKLAEGEKCANTSECSSGNTCIPAFWGGGDPGPNCCPVGKRVCNYGPNAGSGCQFPADCPNGSGRTACETVNSHCYSGNSKECCPGLSCAVSSQGSSWNKCVTSSASSQNSQSIAAATSECSKNSDCKVAQKNVCVLNSNNIGVCQ